MAIVWDKGYGPAISQAFKGLYGSMDRMDALDRQAAADAWRAESQAQQRAGWARREQDWRYTDKLREQQQAAIAKALADEERKAAERAAVMGNAEGYFTAWNTGDRTNRFNIDPWEASVGAKIPGVEASSVEGVAVNPADAAMLGGAAPQTRTVETFQQDPEALSMGEQMRLRAYIKDATGISSGVLRNRMLEQADKERNALYNAETQAFNLRQQALKERQQQQAADDLVLQEQRDIENNRIALMLAGGRSGIDPVGLGMDNDDMGPQGQTQTTRAVGWDDINRVYGAENWADINARLRAMVGQTEATKRLASAGLGGPGAIAQGIQGSVLPQTIRDQVASVYADAPMGVTKDDPLGYQTLRGREPSAWDDYGTPDMVDRSTPTPTRTTYEEFLAHNQRVRELDAAKNRALLGLTNEERALAGVEFEEARNAAQAQRATGESELVNALRQQEARQGRLEAFDQQTLRETVQEQANEAAMRKASANLSGDVLKIGKQILNDNNLREVFAVAEIEAARGESEEDRADREAELTEELRQHNATKLGDLTDALSLQTRRIQAMEGFGGLGQGDPEGFRLSANLGIRAIANKIAQNPTVRLESVDTIQLTRAFAEYMTGNWSLSELEKELKAWDIHDKAATQRDENLYQQDLNTAMNAEAKANQEIDAPRQPYVGELDIAGNMGGGAISTAMGASPAERIYNTSRGRLATGYSTPESEAALTQARKDSAIAQVMRDRNLVGQYDAGPLSGRMSAESYRDHPEVKRTWLQRYFPFGRYN